jgi:hypothetical protein
LRLLQELIEIHCLGHLGLIVLDARLMKRDACARGYLLYKLLHPLEMVVNGSKPLVGVPLISL